MTEELRAALTDTLKAYEKVYLTRCGLPNLSRVELDQGICKYLMRALSCPDEVLAEFENIYMAEFKGQKDYHLYLFPTTRMLRDSGRFDYKKECIKPRIIYLKKILRKV